MKSLLAGVIDTDREGKMGKEGKVRRGSKEGYVWFSVTFSGAPCSLLLCCGGEKALHSWPEMVMVARDSNSSGSLGHGMR